MSRLPHTDRSRRRHRFHEGEEAIWNDGVQDIPVVIKHLGRDAIGIYCRVMYRTADGEEVHDKVHPSQLQPIPRKEALS